MSRTSVQVFTFHLSVLFAAGLPLARCLEVLSQGQDPKMNAVIAHVLRCVDQGYSLSEALATQRPVFTPFYLLLVRVAELTGQLVAVFQRLASTLERQTVMRQRVASALAYPSFVLLSAVAMTAFMVFFLLPLFMKTFESSGAKLPFLTRALVAFVTNPWLTWMPVFLLLLAVGAVWLYGRTPERRGRLQALVTRVPILGRFLFLMALTQVTRSLAVLLENGLDVMKALECVRSSPTGWIPLDNAVKEMQQRIFHGQDIAEALEGVRIMPPLLVHMVAAGEAVGSVHPWFARYTELADEEIQNRVDSVGTILEPLLLLFLGGVVGFIVLACFLPTYQLVTAF